MSRARVIHVHEKEREPPVVDGKVPPADLDAEAAVLAAVILGGPPSRFFELAILRLFLGIEHRPGGRWRKRLQRLVRDE